MASLTLLVPPSVEPISIDDILPDLGYGSSSTLDSATLAVLTARIAPKIAEARQFIEAYLRRSFITQSWTLKLDGFPGNKGRYSCHLLGDHAIVLPMPPLATISSIQYYDVGGALQSMVEDTTHGTAIPSVFAYQVDTGSDVSSARILPAFTLPWPPTRRIPNSVIIQFSAGYGTTAASVPAVIRGAIRDRAKWLCGGSCVNEIPDLTAIWHYRNMF